PGPAYTAGDTSGGFAAASVALGQFTGDAAPDLAFNPVSAKDNGQGETRFVVGVATGNGDGTYHDQAPGLQYLDRYPLPGPEGNTGAGKLLAADINGDGGLDLVNFYSLFTGPSFTQVGRVSVLLNQTGGTGTG